MAPAFRPVKVWQLQPQRHSLCREFDCRAWPNNNKTKQKPEPFCVAHLPPPGLHGPWEWPAGAEIQRETKQPKNIHLGLRSRRALNCDVLLGLTWFWFAAMGVLRTSLSPEALDPRGPSRPSSFSGSLLPHPLFLPVHQLAPPGDGEGTGVA